VVDTGQAVVGIAVCAANQPVVDEAWMRASSLAAEFDRTSTLVPQLYEPDSFSTQALCSAPND
jgi:hypothetical protein